MQRAASAPPRRRPIMRLVAAVASRQSPSLRARRIWRRSHLFHQQLPELERPVAGWGAPTPSPLSLSASSFRSFAIPRRFYPPESLRQNSCTPRCVPSKVKFEAGRIWRRWAVRPKTGWRAPLCGAWSMPGGVKSWASVARWLAPSSLASHTPAPSPPRLLRWSDPHP